MRRTTLENRKLSLHTGRTVVNEKKGTFSVGLSTLEGKFKKNCLKQNLQRTNFVGALWHLAMSAFQLFCSNLLYSSNVFSAFPIVNIKNCLGQQNQRTNFLETIFVRSAHVIYFYSSNVFFDVFRLLKAWLVFPLKGQTTFESKIVCWGGFHGLRCQPLAVSWGEINSNQDQSSWISKSKLKNMVVLGTTFVGLKICAL